MGQFAPELMISSPRVNTAPTGISPRACATRACSSALRMNSVSLGILRNPKSKNRNVAYVAGRIHCRNMLEWDRIAEDLDRYGCATVAGLLTSAQCAALCAGYSDEQLYRSRVVMQRHGFGNG